MVLKLYSKSRVLCPTQLNSFYKLKFMYSSQILKYFIGIKGPPEFEEEGRRKKRNLETSSQGSSEKKDSQREFEEEGLGARGGLRVHGVTVEVCGAQDRSCGSVIPPPVPSLYTL